MTQRKRKKNTDVFTTSDVARICKVSPRIVTKWFDEGKLEGYRLPSSKHRRFQREKLEKFIEENGFPMQYLEEEIQARTEPVEPSF